MSSVSSLELITANQRSLYGYILSLVSSRELADDILQQTNVILCQKIDKFDGRVKFITWACRIAFFQVLAESKRKGRSRMVFLDSSMLEQIATKAEDHALDGDARIAALRQCMAQLPSKSREMIEQRYEPGSGSIESIAECFDQSTGGVKVTLHRIRKALLECIERKLVTEP